MILIFSCEEAALKVLMNAKLKIKILAFYKVPKDSWRFLEVPEASWGLREGSESDQGRFVNLFFQAAQKNFAVLVMPLRQTWTWQTNEKSQT